MSNHENSPGPGVNVPAQTDDEAIRSHQGGDDAPDDFLNDAVSGSDTTSDAAPTPLGHDHDVHPDLEVEGTDITQSEGPDL